MQVVFVADVAGPGGRDGTDTAAAGWRAARPDHEVHVVALADGGPGLLDAVVRPADRVLHVEVAGPEGHPVTARVVVRDDDTAVVAAAEACGASLVPSGHPSPWPATTYGVGQLLDAARRAGAHRIAVGVRGTAAVDGGSGALTGLGFRPVVADGSGLKIGADDLGRVTAVSTGWSGTWDDVEVVVLTTDGAPLGEAAARTGPLAGVSDGDLPRLAAALATWADVTERDLDGDRTAPGTGDGGGVGFGLAAALPRVRWEPEVAAVAALVGADADLAAADLVVTTAAPGSAVHDHLLAVSDGALVTVPAGAGAAEGEAAARRAPRTG